MSEWIQSQIDRLLKKEITFKCFMQILIRFFLIAFLMGLSPNILVQQFMQGHPNLWCALCFIGAMVLTDLPNGEETR